MAGGPAVFLPLSAISLALLMAGGPAVFLLLVQFHLLY